MRTLVMTESNEIKGDLEVKKTILEAIRERVAAVNVTATLAADSNLYSKGPVGDNYAKNSSLEDQASWRVLPAVIRELRSKLDS